MVSENSFTSLKNAKNFHFVGIGGIGMSGLAQCLNWLGYSVTGSDRALNNKENEELFSKLRSQGIKLYQQNGSFLDKSEVDCIIYSTAIENDNPDFIVAKNITKIHRSEALAFIESISDCKESIAITGTCGKTTVSGWLSQVLANANLDPSSLIGGMVNAFSNSYYPGNFRGGDGKFFVYEADESDKSLLAFNPDYSVLLNIGTDHYSESELIEVFEKFLGKTKKGAVIEHSLYSRLSPESHKHLKIVLFKSTSVNAHQPNRTQSVWELTKYSPAQNHFEATITSNNFSFSVKLSSPGYHTAVNALAITALLDLLGMIPETTESINGKNPSDDDTKSVFIPPYKQWIEEYNGISRRFEFCGFNKNETPVYDDYAHNVEKIVSCIKGAKTICKGQVFVIFQPHGYASLRFMKDILHKKLNDIITKKDRFIFLPVYYAGGTSSFSPKSNEVQEEYEKIYPNKYLHFNDRESCENFLKAETYKKDIILILGARDNSLSIWAHALCNT